MRISNPVITTELCSYGCGSVAKYTNGSGKYMCAQSFNSCPALRKKNSSGVKKAHDDGRIPTSQLDLNRTWNKGLTKETDVRLARQAENSRGKPRKGVPHTEEAKKKISSARTEWLKNPENRKIYGRGKRSWMELCFEKWLCENHFEHWETEKHFWNSETRKNYYADFCFESKKLIVELDGNQHLKTKELDAIRDCYLNSLGYTVIRISHKEFKERYFSNKGFIDLLGR